MTMIQFIIFSRNTIKLLKKILQSWRSHKIMYSNGLIKQFTLEKKMKTKEKEKVKRN